MSSMTYLLARSMKNWDLAVGELEQVTTAGMNMSQPPDPPVWITMDNRATNQQLHILMAII